MVLKMYHAQEVDEASSPCFSNMVKELAAWAELPMLRGLFSTHPATGERIARLEAMAR